MTLKEDVSFLFNAEIVVVGFSFWTSKKIVVVGWKYTCWRSLTLLI